MRKNICSRVRLFSQYPRVGCATRSDVGFFNRPKETFPLILNFGATELALPLPASGDVSRCSVIWLASGFTMAGTYGYCTYPSCLYQTQHNSEPPLLALRLLYEQGHGECCKPWQTAGNALMYGLPWSSA